MEKGAVLVKIKPDSFFLVREGEGKEPAVEGLFPFRQNAALALFQKGAGADFLEENPARAGFAGFKTGLERLEFLQVILGQ